MTHTATRTIVLFGAGGFIGRNLLEYLAAKGLDVIPVTREARRIRAGIRAIGMDQISEIRNLEPASTVIINAAAARYDALTFSKGQAAILGANVDIASRVYEFCAHRNIREVRLFSSVAVYPASWAVLDDDRDIDLRDPPNRSELAYAWSKRITETYAAIFHDLSGINTITFRLTNPYGPYDSLDVERAHVAAAFVMRALAPGSSMHIRGNPDAERDFVFVDDVLEILWRSIDVRGRHQVFNIASGQTHSIRELAIAALAAAHADKELVVGEAKSGVATRLATGSRVRQAFEYRAFLPLPEGLARTVEWYRHALQR